MRSGERLLTIGPTVMSDFFLRPCRPAVRVLLAFAMWMSCGASAVRGQRVRTEEAPQVVQSASGATEVGVLDGAEYRIDVPTDWNGSLVVWYHGYAEHGTTFHIADRLPPDRQLFLDRRYAVAESAYSEGGWALQQAYPETEALRHYFDRKYGHPKETFAAGVSMGGALVMITLE